MEIFRNNDYMRSLINDFNCQCQRGVLSSDFNQTLKNITTLFQEKSKWYFDNNQINQATFSNMQKTIVNFDYLSNRTNLNDQEKIKQALNIMEDLENIWIDSAVGSVPVDFKEGFGAVDFYNFFHELDKVGNSAEQFVEKELYTPSEKAPYQDLNIPVKPTYMFYQVDESSPTLNFKNAMKALSEIKNSKISTDLIHSAINTCRDAESIFLAERPDTERSREQQQIAVQRKNEALENAIYCLSIICDTLGEEAPDKLIKIIENLNHVRNASTPGVIFSRSRNSTVANLDMAASVELTTSQIRKENLSKREMYSQKSIEIDGKRKAELDEILQKHNNRNPECVITANDIFFLKEEDYKKLINGADEDGSFDLSTKIIVIKLKDKPESSDEVGEFELELLDENLSILHELRHADDGGMVNASDGQLAQGGLYVNFDPHMRGVVGEGANEARVETLAQGDFIDRRSLFGKASYSPQIVFLAELINHSSERDLERIGIPRNKQTTKDIDRLNHMKFEILTKASRVGQLDGARGLKALFMSKDGSIAHTGMNFMHQAEVRMQELLSGEGLTFNIDGVEKRIKPGIGLEEKEALALMNISAEQESVPVEAKGLTDRDPSLAHLPGMVDVGTIAIVEDLAILDSRIYEYKQSLEE